MKEMTPSVSHSTFCRPRKRPRLNSARDGAHRGDDEHGHGALARRNVGKGHGSQSPEFEKNIDLHTQEGKQISLKRRKIPNK